MKELLEIIERMRSPRARHAEGYRGSDVVDANTVDEWADDLAALVAQRQPGGGRKGRPKTKEFRLVFHRADWTPHPCDNMAVSYRAEGFSIRQGRPFPDQPSRFVYRLETPDGRTEDFRLLKDAMAAARSYAAVLRSGRGRAPEQEKDEDHARPGVRAAVTAKATASSD